MGLFSKSEKQVVTDLGELAEFHTKNKEELANHYQAGLAIVSKARSDALEESTRLDAIGRHYLREAEKLAHEFVVDPPSVPGSTLPAVVYGGGGATVHDDLGGNLGHGGNNAV